MYIKVVTKNNKTYYILALYDKKCQQWHEVFISETIAKALLCNGVKQK